MLLICGGVLTALLLVTSITYTSARDDDRHSAAVECSGSDELDFRCYERRYIELARTAGPELALEDLARLRQRRGFVRSACHQLTHRIGRVAGRAEGIDAVRVRGGDTLCSAGYHHGVSEGIMELIGARKVRHRADSVCAKLRRRERYSFDHYNCAHGMGHGFMALFGSDVADSLAGCNALDDRWEQHNCYGGVFMENLSALGNSKRPPDVRPKEPLYPCTVLARRYRPQCYNQQTTYAVYVTDSDFGEVFRLCQRIEEESRTWCYRGVGGNAAIQSSKLIRGMAAKTDTLRRLCALAPDREARAGCVTGAVRIMLRDVADGESRVRVYCNSYARAAQSRMAAFCQKARADAYRELPLRQEGGLWRSLHCDLRPGAGRRLALRKEE